MDKRFTKKAGIWKYVGALSDMSDEEANKLKKHIEDMRKRAGKHRRKELMRHLKKWISELK